MNTNLEADAAEILKDELVVPVNPELDAAKVYPMPILLILRPENTAMPFTAETVVVPERLPPPGLLPIARETEAVELVTGFPNASCIVMLGARLPPAIAWVGSVVNASVEALPGVISKEVLVADVSPDESTLRV